MTSTRPPQKRTAMLVILDGFGWREDSSDNAVHLARTPNFDRLWQNNPHSFLRTSGEDVGLPEGQMGNSEVGHLNIGAGRVVMQELPRIFTAIADGSLARNTALTDFIATLKKNGGTCHLMGLISTGGVHSHQDHAAALARIVSDAGVPVSLHLFTDGRDTAPRSAQTYLQQLRATLPSTVQLATISGRYYAMDRDKRWDRMEKAYNAMVSAIGPQAQTPEEVVSHAYAQDISDEFILPTVLPGYTGMKDGDGILSFNFRADRIRQLMDALLVPGFDGFARSKVVQFSAALAMTHYSDALADYTTVLFPPEELTNLLGEVIAQAGLRQLRMAETEKYPHVTYFMNGGREKLFEGEDRILVPSPKVATYDLQPEMSAPELTDKAVAAIKSGEYDLIVLNFANPDMVGHTGVLAAAIKAVETVDTGLGRIAQALEEQHGVLLVTADHGNCETMKDPQTGGPHTAHTLNLVPFIVAGATTDKLHDGGKLADLAPTLLDVLNLPKPAEMTGSSLLAH
ncbi:2,3-bisphosphoglycerate-independent phosphoglycerate mutase [Acetobacter syzygii]|uniref:2,3-bisphosphoglycerate-independent phosphoglycerate mutase n=1 Tax=Acetobacter syzygii TaxID=146476 RepID=UPI0005E1D928|nr:2,3-bisphosphoglycerate-independent phosphoglycerate mutase [Acetobacter syzygii]GAN70322.1 phosphoglyceromutase [Acetobacter syzygii]GBR63267.1 phosphoglycerate mutase [Acetobacter syzygii NRIC 0483]GEL55847.1 2,3-bisphosphoglycerate-independent phosphoglycerate mutase [Acetobacter syzygii]